LDLVSGNVSSGMVQMDDHNGYAAKVLRLTAYMLDKSAVWPSKSLPFYHLNNLSFASR